MSLDSVQSFVIENCNGPTIENGLNNVCLHPLSRTFTFHGASELSLCASAWFGSEYKSSIPILTVFISHSIPMLLPNSIVFSVIFAYRMLSSTNQGLELDLFSELELKLESRKKLIEL